MKAALRGALVLGGLMALAGLLLAGVNALTGERVAENRRVERQAVLRELTGADIGMEAHVDLVACARELVVLALTERGYGGTMDLVAAFQDGAFIGIRATRHTETPGFADILDPSDWIGGLARPPGGNEVEFDAVTGATITSSAVLRARAAALQRHADGAPWCRP